jgi:hypothetical protein
LQAGEVAARFGAYRAYTEADAREGKSSEGEQNGQENLEEVEEDRSDEASDPDRRTEGSLGPFCIIRSALEDATRPERRISNGRRAAASMATALFETAGFSEMINS